MKSSLIRNIAIVAHVDHGKTTLIDKLLAQTGFLLRGDEKVERVMDSGDLERERGITILSKNAALSWEGYRINIVDTPGHSDFGGEVERILSMVDSVLLLVDAVEGPMPQTRYVTSKAFENGLRPIVMINKTDRPAARPDWVLDEVFDLFDQLGANEDQLDFPVVYGSGIEGRAGPAPELLSDDLSYLLEVIVDQVPPPEVSASGSFQMQVSSLDYDQYVGVLGLGRIKRGTIVAGEQIYSVSKEGMQRRGKILQVMGFSGSEKSPVKSASAGDIVCVSGIDEIKISDTICSMDRPEALPALKVDEPTISMMFQVNTSPFAGRDGLYITSRQLKERLFQEAKHNVALRVEETAHSESFRVSGRGELHLSVLIETMRREGYEIAIGRPEVLILKTENGDEEPVEHLLIDIEELHQGKIMEEMGRRKATFRDMRSEGEARVRLEFIIATRSLIGFRSQFLTMTSGTGIMHRVFSHYGSASSQEFFGRGKGALVSMANGKSSSFALNNLQARGRLLISSNEEIYEGMIVGLHSRENDLPVNPMKAKQLTNVRAAGTDENISLSEPIRLTVESALEFIEDDELVEVTPNHLRLRKKILTEDERKRALRAST
ncbi:MAG: translational GTPase TypA [Gammaproteobacteria bacterium]|nr:translational GTPase TypA [Gammaproteobacteria bacterium]